jgi:ribosome biogenesis GTP-binding protein YlqF
MSEMNSNINWYPGHMTGARRKMQEDIKLVDCIIEILDARVPLSSRNPDIDEMGKGKGRVILLNKTDLADPAETAKWVNYYKDAGLEVVSLDSRKRNEVLSVNNAVKNACKEKIERDRRRGIMNRPVKAMVAGIPNVGKSTFINSFVGKASAKTGNKPGVTRGNQWIRMSKEINLLDTPGILWPKFEDQSVGYKLAFIGSINDNILDIADICFEMLKYLQNFYCNNITSRYKLEDSDTLSLMEKIALEKKCLKKGGVPDIEKAARLILEDLRSGRLGRITFDRVER